MSLISLLRRRQLRRATLFYRRHVPANTYYVSPTGSDANDGTTPATAWLTFDKVVSSVNNGPVQPGDSVEFANGTYTVAGQKVIYRAGAPGAPITLYAANRGQAHIQWTNTANDTHLWIGSISSVCNYLTFDGLKMSSPRQLNPVLNSVNADWLMRVEPFFGGGKGIQVVNCDIEATGFFKSTGLNSKAGVANWSSDNLIENNTGKVSGALLDYVNVLAPIVNLNAFEMADVSSSSLGIQTKGGTRYAQIVDNVLHLTSGLANAGIILGGGSSWSSNTDYIYDTAGYEGYGHLAQGNVVIADPGCEFTWGFIAITGSIDARAIRNTLIGSGGGRGIHLTRAYWNGWGTPSGYAHTVNPVLRDYRIIDIATPINTDVGVENVQDFGAAA